MLSPYDALPSLCFNSCSGTRYVGCEHQFPSQLPFRLRCIESRETFLTSTLACCDLRPGFQSAAITTGYGFGIEPCRNLVSSSGQAISMQRYLHVSLSNASLRCAQADVASCAERVEWVWLARQLQYKAVPLQCLQKSRSCQM